MEISQCLPHVVRLQRIIRTYLLRQTTSFRNQQIHVLDKVGLGAVLYDLPPPGQDLPVPTFSNLVLLVLPKGFKLKLLQQVGPALAT